MRRTTRWMVAATTAAMVTTAIPRVASAASGERGHRPEGGRTMTSVTVMEAGDRSGAIFGWLFGMMSAFWGEVRSVIVPGDDNGGIGGNALELDPVDGGS